MEDETSQGSVIAIGYATKTGVEIRYSDKRKLKIKSRPVGNMHCPDAQDMEERFFSTLTPNDVVLSPSGPNYTYLVGAFMRTPHVHWIDPGTLKKHRENGLSGKSDTNAILELWKTNPNEFYEYKPSNVKLTALLMAVRDWLNLEQQCTADSNAYAQHLRRERDLAIIGKADRETWVGEYASREFKKLEARTRKVGVKFDKEQKKEVLDFFRVRGEKIFDGFFNASGAELLTAQKTLIQERLAWFGIEELEAEAEKRVREILVQLPESELFEGLIGEDAIKTRAQVLAFIRNPLFYNVFAQLEHYAGVGKMVQGQAERRHRGERQTGRPEFRKALCFDFADKYWQHPGFFQDLYYAYKRHQVLRFWPLIQITAEVYKAFGKKMNDEDGGEDEGVEDDEVDEATLAKTPEDMIRSIATRLEAMGDLPIISQNPDVQRLIASLQKEPDPKLLLKLFSKGNGGYNLQMPPKRIEKQAKRMLGITLLQIVYYRWLTQLGQTLPLDQDVKYRTMWRKVYNQKDGVSSEYDHTIPLRYFQMVGDELERTVRLPVEFAIKLIKPAERKAFLERKPVADRVKALCALTDKDCASFALSETPENRKSLLEMFPDTRREKVRKAMDELSKKAGKAQAASDQPTADAE